MLVRINLQREAVPIVRQMAKDAGIGLADMCEVAVYNLVALWVREHGDPKSVVPTDGLDASSK